MKCRLDYCTFCASQKGRNCGNIFKLHVYWTVQLQIIHIKEVGDYKTNSLTILDF